MPFAVAAAVAAPVIGGIIQGNAAKSAASDSANAAEAGTNAQLQMFDTTQANFAPQVKLGQGAANMLGDIYGTEGGKPTTDYSRFFNTPGYQFSLTQGESAIKRAAAANGSLYSSNTLGALNNYAQGQASTQYNSYINQLLSMAGLGNAAASGVGSAATTTGQGVANSIQNAGNANASGVLGSANAFANGIGANNNLLGSLYGTNNSGAAGQYAGEFGPGVSTNVTYNPDFSSLDSSIPALG